MSPTTTSHHLPPCPATVPLSPQALLSDVQPGDIVAAPFAADGNWYRARVLGPQDNGNLGLHYVDFGDSGEAPRQALCALR